MNVAVVAPAATLTEAGTVSAPLLLESATAAPPEGAAAERVTVQDDDAPDAMLEGEHWTELSEGSAGGAVAVGIAVFMSVWIWAAVRATL